MTAPETLVCVQGVTARNQSFCAGLVVVNDRCTVAAPILTRPCLRKTSDELRALFARNGWRATIVTRS